MDRRATIQGIWEQQTGTLQPLGQIAGAGGATPVTNATTATPFTIPAGARIVLQLAAATTPVAFLANPDCDSGLPVTPTVAGPFPQIAVGQFVATCLFGGGGQGTGFGQTTLSVVSASAFVLNVFRLR